MLGREVLLLRGVFLEVVQCVLATGLMQFPRPVEHGEVAQADHDTLAGHDLAVAKGGPDVLAVEGFGVARFDPRRCGQRGQQVQDAEDLAGLRARLENAGPANDGRDANTALPG